MNIKDIAPFLIGVRRGNITTTTDEMTWSDGFSLWFREGGYGNVGKLRVAFSRPRDASGQYLTIWEKSPLNGKVSDPSINVSATKSPEQVAKDIKRRLLPEAERVFALATEVNRLHNDFETNKVEAIETLANICGTKPERHYDTKKLNGEIDPYKGAGLPSFKEAGYGKFMVSGKDSISLELKSMDFDTAILIAEALRKVLSSKA